MTWQVIEYLDQNPEADIKEVVGHYAETMEVDQQIDYLKGEVESVVLLREQLRPLYAKKFEAENQMAVLNSEFEMNVMRKYPPRKGTDKERKAYKLEIQMDSKSYQTHQEVVDGLKDKIEKLEDELYMVQENAKNARRILETFNNYVNFAIACQTSVEEEALINKESNPNDNVF